MRGGMHKNILLTGAPSSGKTTVIKKVIEQLPYPAAGFYTEEEKQGNKRIGFLMQTLDGSQGYLAHRSIQSPCSIRRYGVSIQNIERFAVPSIRPRRDTVIIIDEIGKMECFSDLFKQAAIEALDAENIVVGTITLGGDAFIQAIKSREDIVLTEVSRENRNLLPARILQTIAALCSFPLQRH